MSSPPHLVLAVVILRVPEDSVAESEHVLVGSILLVGQLLQAQQRTFPSWPVLKGGLQDAEDLIKTHKHTLSDSWKSFRTWCLYYLMLHSEGVRGHWFKSWHRFQTSPCTILLEKVCEYF